MSKNSIAEIDAKILHLRAARRMLLDTPVPARTLSPTGKKRIAAAQKARWAKWRREQK